MRWLKAQWPFWLGGVFVGLAEVVFYFKYDYFIPVTTGLAQMYAVAEQKLVGLDFIARVYEPGVHWVIVGAVLAAWLVTKLERESRAWVRYEPKMLALAFVGGILFSFGTRIAGGCTTHHFLGGIPAMSIASWVVLLTGIPFAFLALKIAMGLGLGGYYRHQDTRAVVRMHNATDPHPGYRTAYRPGRDPLRWALIVFALLVVLLPVGYGLFGDIHGSVRTLGWSEAAWMMLVGALLGFGIAKSGFGTECGVMAPEAMWMRKESLTRQGLPACSFNMFRGMLPLQGLLIAIVLFHLVILGRWLWFAGPLPNASGDAGLYWGHVLGGPLLAMGAVFMIGCEVRTYGRLGLGYGTALAALPGFYLGYLPYTLYKESIDAVVFGAGLVEHLTVPQMLAARLGGTETIWALAYASALVALLVWSFGVGKRFFKVSLRRLLRANTDELACEA